jgi:hypothetical protein
MDFRFLSKIIFFPILFFVLLAGCATQPRGPVEPPPFPDGWMSAKWGASVEEVKEAIEKDEIRFFQDDAEKPPYALYASGTYLGEPSIFSYFFTPKSKKLFRVDVTCNDPKVYEKIRGELMQRFKTPTFSQKDVDHWSWMDYSLVILQKESSFVQVSYSERTLSKLNHQEGDGLHRK